MRVAAKLLVFCLADSCGERCIDEVDGEACSADEEQERRYGKNYGRKRDDVRPVATAVRSIAPFRGTCAVDLARATKIAGCDRAAANSFFAIECKIASRVGRASSAAGSARMK